MKRFHVHVAVDNLESNIRFYSALFGAQPSVTKDDYAKWMLEDPRVNFAISMRGDEPGVNHLGIQADSDNELLEMRNRASAAERPVLDQPGAACCYAASNKHWIQDPQGIAWEAFHTLSDIPVFGGDTRSDANSPGTGTPGAAIPSTDAAPTRASACCVPQPG